MNIGKIRHKGLKRLYESDDGSLLPAAAVPKLRRMMTALAFAGDISQLETVPGWRLHPLKGSRKGQYAMSVTGNWRLVFRLEDRTVTDIDFVDYH